MPNEATIRSILALLGDTNTYSPKDLLQALQQQGISQADAKEGLSQLILEEQVELTAESSLRRLEAVAA